MIRMCRTYSRPGRFRPVLTMVLLAIVLFLGWLGLEVYFAVTAKPNPTIDYGKLAEEQIRTYQVDREGEDVWSLLIETTMLFGDTIADLQDEETQIVWGTGYYSFDAYYEYESLRADLEEQEADSPFFETSKFDELEAHRRMAIEALGKWDEMGISRRLDEIAASGKAVRPMPDTTQTSMIEILLPELGTIRNMARALLARMIIARRAGDWTLYAKSFEQGLALGRIEMDQATLIDRLVGIAIRAMMFGQLGNDLATGELPAEACELLQSAMDRQSKTSPLSHSLDIELNMLLDAVQWTHDRRGRVILSRIRQLDYSGGPGPSIMNLASIVFPRRAETEAWFREYNERVKAIAERPVAQRCADQRSGVAAEPEYTSSWKTVIQDLLVPAYSGIIRSDDQLRMQEHGVVVMLAIERYRNANGKLPDSLELLTPEWLEKPATDPYSIDGNLLGYRVLPERDERGRTYMLYSVAFDGEDNGGALPTENTYDALRAGYPDTDYVLTEPNR